MDNPVSSSPALLTYDAVTRYMEYGLYDSYKASEAVQNILQLDMDANGTKRMLATNAMRSRDWAFLEDHGGGRRALRTNVYEDVSSNADWQDCASKPSDPSSHRVNESSKHRIIESPATAGGSAAAAGVAANDARLE